MRVKLKVKITPNAKKNEIKGFKEEILYVKISAPPIGGKANRELLKFFEKIFKVKNIKIVSGEKSRLKIIDIPLSMEDISKALKN
ncbi:MAG: YggU family protein [Caldiserica bacterium]|nr:MAG: YggU family protein [Caldisericota bacterium]